MLVASMKVRFKLIPAAYLFLIKDERVLLMRRAGTGYKDGEWGLPAGHFDGDEAGTMAMVREAREEIGIKIDPAKLKLVHLMHRNGLDGGDGKENERIDLFFTLQEWTGEPTNCEPHKCDALQWFPLDALPAKTIDYMREALESYRDGIIYSERGWV